MHLCVELRESCPLLQSRRKIKYQPLNAETKYENHVAALELHCFCWSSPNKYPHISEIPTAVLKN
jgi:hypothetical protein